MLNLQAKGSFSFSQNPFQKGTFMFRSTKRSVTLAAVALLALTGCTTSSDSASAENCPDAPLKSAVLPDVTSSSFTGQIGDEYESAIARVASRTAACSGDLWVATFGDSSGQTVTLLEQSFQVEAPTENAQRRKREKLAEEATAAVRDRFAEAAANTSASATDILGLLRLAAENKAQHPDAAHELLVLTDGFTNVGVDPAAAASTEAAIALADQVAVPDLSGMKLTFAGIGRTTSTVPSSVIEKVTAFWERVCERTNADSCTVVTKWQG